MTFTAPTQYLTAAGYLDFVNVFSSILRWRGHANAMAISERHAGVALGEIDEPDEDSDGYNPMHSAGFFGINAAVQALIYARAQDETNRRAVEAATPVAVQLMFALLSDELALAETVRYLRTGFIGASRQSDVEHVPTLVAYLRKMNRFSEDFEKRAAANDWNSPLTRTVYPYPGPSRVEQLPVERIVDREDSDE